MQCSKVQDIQDVREELALLLRLLLPPDGYRRWGCRLQLAGGALGRCVPARDGHWTHLPWPRPRVPSPHCWGDKRLVRKTHGQGGRVPELRRLPEQCHWWAAGIGAGPAPAVCQDRGAAGWQATNMTVKHSLRAKLVQLVDQCGKTPPRLGVRSSSGGRM